MEIKTVCRIFTEEGLQDFDREVNELLATGWRLANRGYVPGCDFGTSFFRLCCYAELVKLDEADMEDQEADPVTWQEAVNVLCEACQCADDCSEDGCPMFTWCQKNLPADPPPANWDDPAKLEQPE